MKDTKANGSAVEMRWLSSHPRHQAMQPSSRDGSLGAEITAWPGHSLCSREMARPRPCQGLSSSVSQCSWEEKYRMKIPSAAETLGSPQQPDLLPTTLNSKAVLSQQELSTPDSTDVISRCVPLSAEEAPEGCTVSTDNTGKG